MLTGLPKNGDFRFYRPEKNFSRETDTIAAYIQLIRIFEQKITKN